MTTIVDLEQWQSPGGQTALEGLECMNLNLEGDSDMLEVLASLRATPSVRRVGLSFYQLLQSHARSTCCARNASQHTAHGQRISRKRSRPDNAWDVSVGSLHYLEEITFSGGMAMRPLPVSSLTTLLRATTNIQTLQLSRIQLLGDAEDFEDLAECLKTLIVLKTFICDGCKMASTDILQAPTRRRRRHDKVPSSSQSQQSPGFAINDMLKALVSLPAVVTIQVSAQKLGTGGDMGFLFPGTLEALCWSNSLKRLVLKGFLLNADHIYAMAPGIATSDNLEQIILHKCCLLLGNNNSNGNFKIDDCLTHMLQANTSLQLFELPALTGANNPRWVQMASKVLQKNTTLKVLHLGCPCNLGNESSVRKHLATDSEDAAMRSVQFHLKLNQAGRSQLLGKDGITSANVDWVNVIGNVSNDLDCVHYFLSRNPSLCGHTSVC
jgi:hypothetical protein